MMTQTVQARVTDLLDLSTDAWQKPGKLEDLATMISCELPQEWQGHCLSKAGGAGGAKRGFWMEALQQGPQQVVKRYSPSKREYAESTFRAFLGKLVPGTTNPFPTNGGSRGNGQSSIPTQAPPQQPSIDEQITQDISTKQAIEMLMLKEEDEKDLPATPDRAKAQGAAQWYRVIKQVREILTREGLPLFASPRFDFAALSCMQVGDSWEEALEASLWQGLPEDTLSAVKRQVLNLRDELPKVGLRNGSDITDKIVVAGKHKLAKRIKRYLKARKYPFLFGSPGAGKSHLAMSLASDMGLECQVLTLNLDSTRGEILGTKSPLTGEYFPSKFRRLWASGGVVLLDEVGMASGQIANLLNGALAQKSICFPDGSITVMHNDFFLLLADNSNLWGTDPLFPERSDLGGAFRDRLSYIPFGYDEPLELSIVEGMWI